jgi:hypothetical protein
VLGGIGTILVVLLWSWWFPALRRVDRLVAADLVARTTASEQQ